MKLSRLFIKIKKLVLGLPNNVTKTIAQTLRTQKLALLSGLLIGTSYIPFPPWALLVCLVPLWGAVLRDHQASWKKTFWLGWWTQFVFTLIGFHWISYVAHDFGFMPWPVAILVLVIFATVAHLYFALATAGAQWLRQKLFLSDTSTVLVLACLTGFGEILWPSPFPWNFGYPLLWMHSPLAQIADVVGFQGLSLLVLFANAALTLVVHQYSGKIFPALRTVGILLVAIAALAWWGKSKQAYWQKTDQHLQVLQVQPNIGNFEKEMAFHGAGFEQFIIERYFTLTRQALQKSPNVDLVLWPESAYPDFLNPADLTVRPYATQFVHFVQEINKPIMTGGYSHVFNREGAPQFFNALFLYGPATSPQPLVNYGSYHKTNLLVFGEYTPFTDYFPWLATISPAGMGFNRGPGPQVIAFGPYLLGPQICYESLYPDFSRKLAQLGADVLVNVTNDSWFGPTFEPYQHMTMTLARAIEVRRPLVRNTNTGFTTAILADGTQLQKSSGFSEWAEAFDIPLRLHAEQTFFSQYGSWLPWALLLFLLGIILQGQNRARP